MSTLPNIQALQIPNSYADDPGVSVKFPMDPAVATTCTRIECKSRSLGVDYDNPMPSL